MSALLFNMVKKTTEDATRGIGCNITSKLEDLDFDGDLALLSHTHHHWQEKTNRLHNFAHQVGLKISQTKTEVMALNITNPSTKHVDGKDLPITAVFTYLVCTLRNNGGAGNDTTNRLNKFRNVLRTLNNVCKSSQYSKPTKLKLYQSCVLSTLLYGSECWRMTENDLNKLLVFFILKTALEKSCVFSGPTRVLTNTYLDKVIEKVWLYF